MSYINICNGDLSQDSLKERFENANKTNKLDKEQLCANIERLYDEQKISGESFADSKCKVSNSVETYNKIEKYLYAYTTFEKAHQMIELQVKSLQVLQKHLIECEQEIEIQILDFSKNPSIDLPMFRVV